MKKSCIILLLSIVCIVSVIDSGLAEPSKRWKIGHLRQSGSAIDKDLHQFIEEVNAGAGNIIECDVYTGNKLGDYSVVQERVSFGEVQLYVGPLSTAIDKRLLLATTPYLVSNWTEAQAMYSQGSEMLQILGGFLKDQNIKLLGGWPVYFGGIALAEKPAHPENPDLSQNVIIRVPPIKSFELSAKSLGYTPYPITWTYAKMGMRTGMVGGMIGGGAEGYSGMKELVKYYIPVKDHFEYWFMYMNMDEWKKLSIKEQKLFTQTAKKIEAERYLTAPSQEKKSIEMLQKQGTQLISISDEALATMKEKVEKEVWPLLEIEVGEVFNTITSGSKITQ